MILGPMDLRSLQEKEEVRYRIRVGDYRIVYRVLNDVLTVLVVAVGHRREVYRNL